MFLARQPGCDGPHNAALPTATAVSPGDYSRSRPARIGPMPSRNPQSPPPYALDRETLEREVVLEAFRSTGAGGQHVNKTESALRLTHLPSGVVIVARDTRSQHRNREVAFERLVERLRRLNHVPVKRVPTKPTFASRKRRLETKKVLGKKKQARGRVRGDE